MLGYVAFRLGVCCRERKARLGVSGFEEVMGMGALAMGESEEGGRCGGREEEEERIRVGRRGKSCDNAPRYLLCTRLL
jgi:hypothetical protein